MTPAPPTKSAKTAQVGPFAVEALASPLHAAPPTIIALATPSEVLAVKASAKATLAASRPLSLQMQLLELTRMQI